MERLRVRSEKRPVYNLDDDSDDELMVRQGSWKTKHENTVQKIVRDDVVLFSSSIIFMSFVQDFNSRVFNAEENVLVKRYDLLFI